MGRRVAPPLFGPPKKMSQVIFRFFPGRLCVRFRFSRPPPNPPKRTRFVGRARNLTTVAGLPDALCAASLRRSRNRPHGALHFLAFSSSTTVIELLNTSWDGRDFTISIWTVNGIFFKIRAAQELCNQPPAFLFCRRLQELFLFTEFSTVAVFTFLGRRSQWQNQ